MRDVSRVVCLFMTKTQGNCTPPAHAMLASTRCLSAKVGYTSRESNTEYGKGGSWRKNYLILFLLVFQVFVIHKECINNFDFLLQVPWLC